MDKFEELLDKLATNNGTNKGYIPGVSIFRSDEKFLKAPLKYESRMIFLARGNKTGYLGGKTLIYNKNNYLVLSIPMAFECEASENCLALILDIDTNILGEIISKIENKKPINNIKNATNAISLNTDLKNTLIRLLEISFSKQESEILGKNIIKEIYYRVLQDTGSESLFALYNSGGNFARFSQLIHEINLNLSKQYSLLEMSKQMAMSESSLNRYFKKYTSFSPLTYIKNIKLQKAKELIEQNNLSLKEITKHIGYKSMSQFSREYSRYFGFTPKKTKRI